MPFYLNRTIFNDGKLALWQVTEPVNYFTERCILTEEEKVEYAPLSDRKKLEWCTSRYLIQLLHDRNGQFSCLKDEYGKPTLINSGKNISLSHSNTMTAVIYSDDLVGVDIQVIVNKIERIAPKFVNDDELDLLGFTNRLETLHSIWGAKESIYKAYGKKSLDFKKNMVISELDFKKDGCKFKGKLIKNDIIWDFDVWAEQIDNYILVYAIKK